MDRDKGSFTFEESLAQLVSRGWIEADEARARTIHGEALDGLLQSAPPSGTP